MTQVVICCGAGGVGKTTTSAAIALRAAWEGRKVAALTIDPARRLADSLGVPEVGNVPRRIPVDQLAPRGDLAPDPGQGPPVHYQAGGSLDVMMLDAKSAFDEVILEYSPDEDAARRILQNRYYRFVSSKLAGSQEYMAMVRLHDMVVSGRHDLVVLDTPPTRHALDFLTAPERITRVMDRRVLKVLALGRTTSGLKALQDLNSASMKVLDRLIGVNTIQELGDFVALFEGMTDRFKQRSEAVRRLLRSRETSFLLVITSKPSSHAEASDFLEVIRQEGLPFSGFVVNRCAQAPREAPVGDDPAFATPPPSMDPGAWERISRAVKEAPALYSALARADAESLERFRRRHGTTAPMWTVPAFDQDIHEISAVLALGLHLPPVQVLAPRS